MNKRNLLTSMSSVIQSTDMNSVVTDVSWSTAAWDSALTSQSQQRTAASTSCALLLDASFPPSIISSRLYSLTVLPHLSCHSSSLLPSSAPCTLLSLSFWSHLLSSPLLSLRSSLPTLKVSQEFLMESGLSGSLFLCNLQRLYNCSL